MLKSNAVLYTRDCTGTLAVFKMPPDFDLHSEKDRTEAINLTKSEYGQTALILINNVK